MIQIKKLRTATSYLILIKVGKRSALYDRERKKWMTTMTTPQWFTTLSHHWAYRWRWSPFPIYWDRYSRDCDHCAATWCERHPNGWTAYRSYCDALDYAEGPEHFSRITKAEYLKYKDQHTFRDHILEAHENGHPHSVAE
jgi:hypothetical protein